MADARVAVVTGANRGIGFEVCRQLGRDGRRVVLGARDVVAGEKAAGSLRDEGHDVTFRHLDVTDSASIDALASSLGRCDVLVNNAGVVPDGYVSFFDTSLEGVRLGMETNVYGPLMLCQRLVPLMRRGGYGRIVNVSTGMAQLEDMGGGATAYRLSKTALNALTRNLAAELRGENILVNCLNPGWVKTDMGGAGANRSVEQGADTVTWLATLPDGGPSGGFFQDRRPIPW